MRTKKWMSKLIIVLIFACSLMVISCDENRVFEQNVEIPNKSWSYDQVFPFEAEIKDTNLRYNVYINLRHTNEYTNSNFWLMLYTTFPSGEKIERRVELPLASKEGKWYGNSGGSIVAHQVLIQPNAIFQK